MAMMFNVQTDYSERSAMPGLFDVARFCENQDMYALRKTHISWARRLVNADSVKLQVGHAPQDVEERHYLDLVDARESAQAVGDMLTAKALAKGRT